VILWHLGIAVALCYLTLGRRRIDYRYILVGAILPDVVDGILTLFFDWEAGRGIAHSIAALVLVWLVILFGVRDKDRRLQVFGIFVGWLLHLVADGMWNSPKTFLWPAFGTEFDVSPQEPYSWELFTAPLDHLSTWGAELVGLAILVWFYVAFEMNKEDRLKLFLRDGYLRP
jgi:membrane-bound metal-dependent hydrolase YbcI (DUF457 family)